MIAVKVGRWRVRMSRVIYCISAAVVLLKTVLALSPVNSHARSSTNDHVRCSVLDFHGARTQGVMMIFEVFFRLPDHLPKSLRRYDPLHCTPRARNQGFSKKDFEGLAFPNTLAGGPPTIAGEEILKNTWHVKMG
ncbi:hypothetical protein SADUNF_Sadunf07G0083300 [Salix dunnii]|uniref:Uncharacterized protein n=1 Tax=Salix dunnii TaxID=1413687 RepID=A0A835MZ81_9ROSI|nr:hypothetical protein SADUNF_Sadunf07G0083300 [Salix dunnii]